MGLEEQLGRQRGTEKGDDGIANESKDETEHFRTLRCQTLAGFHGEPEVVAAGASGQDQRFECTHDG